MRHVKDNVPHVDAAGEGQDPGKLRRLLHRRNLTLVRLHPKPEERDEIKESQQNPEMRSKAGGKEKTKPLLPKLSKLKGLFHLLLVIWGQVFLGQTLLYIYIEMP